MLQPVYLDHAATTPMRPVAIEAMSRRFGEVGNASSLHAAGRRARRVVEESRETIAGVLGCRPGEVVFTSGGTESDNLAIKGLWWQRHAEDPRRTRIVSAAAEHHAVLDPLQWLADNYGAALQMVGVDQHARIDLEELRRTVESDPESVALITLMWANNEVGTIQPIAEVAELAAAYGIPLHTDAVQAVGSVPVDFGASGVDALSFSGHKLGGPYGAGGLLLRRDLSLTPLLHGGGQEREIRSGTLDVPAIAGLAAAVEWSVKHSHEHAERLAGLRDRLVAGIREVVPDAISNGDPVNRLPGHAHVTIPGCEGDSLLLLLDAAGIACSTGSACSAGVPQPSHVLLAMGRSEEHARSSLRFSLGCTSHDEDVDAVLSAIGPVVERVRGARVR